MQPTRNSLVPPTRKWPPRTRARPTPWKRCRPASEAVAPACMAPYPCRHSRRSRTTNSSCWPAGFWPGHRTNKLSFLIHCKEYRMNPSRRTALKSTGAFATLISLGLVTQSQAQAAVDRASFQVKTLEDALKALGGQPAVSDQVTVVAPDIAENGAVVPVGASSKLPNTTEIYLIVEKNPTPLAAGFILPAGTVPDVQTRLK